MNEKITRQVEEMKQQTIGVEVEMNGITRDKAARLAAAYFGTGRYESTAGRNGCSTWSAWDGDGREWKFQKDVSIAGCDSEKCELVTKKRVANDGTVPQYYVNNDHEAIIPRELFARVQEEMKRRANIRQGMDGKRRVYSSKYALSSIVFCGHCGDMYRRTHWNNHGKKQIVWRCVTRLNAPGVECPARTLSEIQLQNLVLEAINKVLGGKQRAIKVLETNISEVVVNTHSEELERIKQQIEKQQTLLVKMTAASEDYSKVVDKIYALQREQEKAMAANVNYKAGKERIQEMIEYLKSQPKRVTVYDEQLVRKLIEKITVYDDHLDFLFKSGIQIEMKG